MVKLSVSSGDAIFLNINASRFSERYFVGVFMVVLGDLFANCWLLSWLLLVFFSMNSL